MRSTNTSITNADARPVDLPPVTVTTVPSLVSSTTTTVASTTSTTIPSRSSGSTSTTTTTTKPQAQLPIETQDLSAYAKVRWVLGVPVVSSNVVSDAAHTEMRRIMEGMLQTRPALLDPFKQIQNFRIILRGLNEQTIDLPDVVSRPSLRNWIISIGGDARVGGGIGCSVGTPITIASEANLLRRSDDPWRGESAALHEFAHLFVSCAPNSAIESQVITAYNAAIAAGLWTNTYAGTNYQEYWAEGVQSYFNTNIESDPPNGIHNFVNTRGELMSYDRALFNVIEQFFGASPWLY